MMLSVLFKLGWFFKEHKTRYIVGVVMLIVVGIIELVPLASWGKPSMTSYAGPLHGTD